MKLLLLWFWVSLTGVLESLKLQNYVRINHQLHGTKQIVNNVTSWVRCAYACDRITCQGFLWNKDAENTCELLTVRNYIMVAGTMGTETYLPTIYGDKRILFLPQIQNRAEGEALCRSVGGDLPGYPETEEEKEQILAFGRFFISPKRSNSSTDFVYPNGTVLDVSDKWKAGHTPSNSKHCLLLVYDGLINRSCENHNDIPIDDLITLCVMQV